MDILEDNRKLVEQFDARPISAVKELPDFYTFTNGVVYSHRDFDQFMRRADKGDKSAIVSGFNASGTIHLGHKGVFDTNLFFQRKYKMPVFIPISDDESYVSKKVETQEQAIANAKELVKDMLAFGYDKKLTCFIIDHYYTNIYNLAIKLSRHLRMSEIKAIYGYKSEENIGLHFYPAVQSAHVLLPEHLKGIRNTLVPIGPDEDAHLRSARDAASRTGYEKPAVIHLKFMPGVDGEKMSKSRNNAIFYHDDDKTIRKKVMNAFSGGQSTVEEHRKKGGNPDVDVSCIYLSSYFLSRKESEKLFADYRSGALLSGDVKNMLLEKLLTMVHEFKEKREKVTEDQVESTLMRNGF